MRDYAFFDFLTSIYLRYVTEMSDFAELSYS